MNIGRNMVRRLGRSRFIRFGIRDKVARLIHHPDFAYDEKFKTELFGYIYYGNMASFIDWSIYYFGCYAECEIFFLKDLLSIYSDPVCLDVGANIGNHSLCMSLQAKQVYSFEPNPCIYEKLNRTIQENKINNITSFPVALGARNDSLDFYYPLDNNEGTGGFLEPKTSNKKRSVKIDVKNGDEFLKSISIAEMNIIKIDVEGYEKEVLAGLHNTIKRYRPACFFEWTQTSRGDKSSRPVDFFPSDYLFFKLFWSRPYFIFLSREPYFLKELVNEGCLDGNLFACPRELFEHNKEKLRLSS